MKNVYDRDARRYARQYRAGYAVGVVLMAAVLAGGLLAVAWLVEAAARAVEAVL